MEIELDLEKMREAVEREKKGGFEGSKYSFRPERKRTWANWIFGRGRGRVGSKRTRRKEKEDFMGGRETGIGIVILVGVVMFVGGWRVGRRSV